MTAKEMFKKLGYEYSKNKNGRWICYDIYNPIQRRAIWFNVKGKTIVVGAYQAVTLSELKAINKQVEELEWND